MLAILLFGFAIESRPWKKKSWHLFHQASKGCVYNNRLVRLYSNNTSSALQKLITQILRNVMTFNSYKDNQLHSNHMDSIRHHELQLIRWLSDSQQLHGLHRTLWSPTYTMSAPTLNTWSILTQLRVWSHKYRKENQMRTFVNPNEEYECWGCYSNSQDELFLKFSKWNS